MAGYGMLIAGPTLHLWFNFLSKVLPKRDLLSTLKKMIVGQTVYGPIITTVFFSQNAAFQGIGIWNSIQSQLAPTCFFLKKIRQKLDFVWFVNLDFVLLSRWKCSWNSSKTKERSDTYLFKWNGVLAIVWFRYIQICSCASTGNLWLNEEFMT